MSAESAFGNFSKTFEVILGIFGYAFQEPRFKEILGADGYDVGIPRAFPGSGVCSGMHDWTTSNDVNFWVKNEAVFQARPGKQDGCGIFWRREVGKSRLKLFNIAQAKELQLSIVSLTKFHPFIPSCLFIFIYVVDSTSMDFVPNSSHLL